MDARIFGIMQRVHAEADVARKADLMAESNGELAQHFATHTADMEELSFELFNLAWRDVMGGPNSTDGAQDIVGTLIDTKTVGLGDSDFIEEDLRGMRAYFQGKGGQIRSDIIRYERAQMPREELVTAIDMHQDQILTDFWGSLGALQAQAKEKLREAPAQRLIQLIQQSVIGGASYGTFAAATLTDTQLDPILDAVGAMSGGHVTIFGTTIAIRKLANVGLDFGATMQERIFQSGVIATYKGYPVLQLSNWEDFAGGFVLPDNELYIIGRNAGRLTWFGATPKVQFLQLPSFMRRWETARDVGISVYGAAKGRIGRIVLT